MVNGDYEEQSVVLDKFQKNDSSLYKWSDVIPYTSRSNSITYYLNSWEGRIPDFRFAFGTAEYSLDSTVMFVDSSGTKALLNWAQDSSKFIDIKTDDYENAFWKGTTPVPSGKKEVTLEYVQDPSAKTINWCYLEEPYLILTTYPGKQVTKIQNNGVNFWLDFSKSTATHLEFTDGTILDYYHS